MNSVYKNILDFLFPNRCAGCRKPGDWLCSRCILLIEPSCKNNCKYATSIFDYRNPIIKKLLWQLKYRGKTDIAYFLGNILYDIILEDLAEKNNFEYRNYFTLVPIPLSKKGLRKRGFNQSELIAKALHVRDGHNNYNISVGALYKIKDTPKQMTLGRNERLKNLRGSFSAKRSAVLNKHIILIDDIITTGATIAEARRTLLAAGAKSVLAYTIAH